jgi:hypothetical protein
MAELTIHSHLNGFELIEHLFEVGATTIGGTGRFEHSPCFVGLEAMAQVAALHVRYLLDFKRHAFLLKVAWCDLPAVAHLQGRFDLQADLLSQSSNAFAYGVKARGVDRERACLAAELLIGTQPYDDQFQKEYLQEHYHRRFNRLYTQQPQTSNHKP